MPQITAFAKVFRDWEGLIGACIQNLALLPGLEAILALLQANLAEARQLKIEQENHEGRRKALTQRLDILVEEGRENARKLRGLVLAQLGSRSEQLTQFGVPPDPQGGAPEARREEARAAAAGGGVPGWPDVPVAIIRRREPCRTTALRAI